MAPASEASSSGSPTLSEKGRYSFSMRRSKRRSRTSSNAGTDTFADDWGKSSDEQDEYVQKFREYLSQEGVKEQQDYFTLLRFLRARDYDIQRAGTMYLSHLKWRSENGIDTILEDFQFTEREPYLQVYPQGYYMTDKLGRPMSIQHLGKVDPKRIKEITTEERMIRFHVQEYERFLKHIAPVCSKVYGRQVDQIFAILDVKGVTIRTLTGDVTKVVRRITGVAQDHYPETLGKTCIINAPFYFQAVWALIKPMLQPRTVNKVTLLGTKYMDELIKFVDIESIPEYMGGKCPHTLLDDPGPWSDPQVLSRLGMITEENEHHDSPENLHLNEAEAEGSDSPSAGGGAPGNTQQSPLTPAQSSTKTPIRGHTKDGSESSEVDIRLPTFPQGVIGNPTFEPRSALGSSPSPATLLRRIHALEEVMRSQDMPAQLSSLPTIPPKSLLARVELLESAMTSIIQLQEKKLQEERARALESNDQASQGCCCMM